MFRLKIPEILLKKPLKMSEVAPDHGTSREGNKRGGLLPFSQNFPGQVEQKCVKYL